MKKFNDKKINNDICLDHKIKYECFCFECNKHLCKNCLKTRKHINHQKVNIIEVQPNDEELKTIEKIINEGNVNKLITKDIYRLNSIIYETYKNFSNNYYNAINLNKILINYYKDKFNKDYENSINIKINQEEINKMVANYDKRLAIIREDIEAWDNKFKKLKDKYDEKLNEYILIYKTKKYENGDRYKGEFRNNIREGVGFLYRNDGGRYEGEFKNDKAEGKGIFYFNNGDRYEGEFKNDKKEGKGVFYFNNGDRYEGEFQDDNANGKGVYYYYDLGARYEGDWKDNKKEGKGILYYDNGDRLIGDYSNDEPIGNHAFFSNKGKLYLRYYY